MSKTGRSPEGFSSTSLSAKKLEGMFVDVAREAGQMKEPQDVTKVLARLTAIGDVLNTAIDEYFESAPQEVQDFFTKYHIPRSTILISAVAAVVGSLVYIAVAYGARILSYFVGVLQPLYHTFKALETEEKDDDTLWLTYWMVYGFMSFLDETVLAPVVALFPLVYYVAKMAFMIYIVNFNGAVVVYEAALQPFFRESLEKAKQIVEEIEGDDEKED